MYVMLPYCEIIISSNLFPNKGKYLFCPRQEFNLTISAVIHEEKNIDGRGKKEDLLWRNAKCIFLNLDFVKICPR